MSSIKPYHSKAIDSILAEIDPEIEERIEFRMQLAAKIDKARINMRLSKKQFAVKLSKSPSVITKWLSGTHNFTSDTLFEIQRLLRVDLINIEDRPQEEILHFSMEVTQEQLISSLIPGFSRQNDFSDLIYKTSASKISMPGLYNLKITAEA